MKTWMKVSIIIIVTVALAITVYQGSRVLENQELIIKRQQILIQDHNAVLTALSGTRNDLNVINDNLLHLQENLDQSLLDTVDREMENTEKYNELIVNYNDIVERYLETGKGE